MFAIGETREEVHFSKLKLPKEYNLRRSNRTIYSVWVGDWTLYLSDETVPLQAKSGRDGIISKANIDAESRISVPSYLENKTAHIRGCITTIEIEFTK